MLNPSLVVLFCALGLATASAVFSTTNRKRTLIGHGTLAMEWATVALIFLAILLVSRLPQGLSLDR